MMKKASIVVLAALAMAACKNMGSTPQNGSETTGGGQTVETVYDIAYIRMDSLVTKYDRYTDLSNTFETKATKVQNDLEARARSLEGEVRSFQEKVQKGLMTSRDAASEQNRIETKGQKFEADRQNSLAELAEEEQVMTNQVLHAINEYVAKFNADGRYKMILTSSGSTPVIHAAPGLDITNQVLKGLNEEYATEKAAAKKN
jgi:outer membrane protein